jgi:hypothetical protein
MDAEALNTFLTVYRQRGFSTAARVLNRTQPAISHRISLLEQELGMPLFERMSNGIALSQAGRVLLPYAEHALAALQDAETAVRALKTEVAGPVSLAIVGTLASTRLTGILKRFAAGHPSDRKHGIRSHTHFLVTIPVGGATERRRPGEVRGRGLCGGRRDWIREERNQMGGVLLVFSHGVFPIGGRMHARTLHAYWAIYLLH